MRQEMFRVGIARHKSANAVGSRQESSHHLSPADRGRVQILLATLILVTAPVVTAHDFWLEPSTYRAEVGDRIGVDLKVGEHFQGDSVARMNHHIRRFLAQRGDEQRPLGGIIGIAPAGMLRIESRGLQVVTYESNPTRVELDPLIFEAYLEEEGLERVIRIRASRGESGLPGVESFSRCAKTLIQVVGDGEAIDGDFDREIGMPLEIIPEANPFDVVLGDELSVRVLFEAEPVEGLLVIALSAEDSSIRRAVRTDERGRVAFVIDRKGSWLIKAVHMERAPEDRSWDWESWWASLTFAT